MEFSLKQDAELKKTRETFRKTMFETWSSAAKMTDDLHTFGIYINEKTCTNWRNGRTEPSYSLGQLIRRAILKKTKKDIKYREEVLKDLSNWKESL